jgi:hypothetical protein
LEWNAGADFSSASSDFRALGAIFCNFATSQLRHSRGLSGVAHGQPRARVPDLVGSRFPSPYHFWAWIQSFQAVAAPFPGDSVFAVSLSRRDPSDRDASV